LLRFCMDVRRRKVHGIIPAELERGELPGTGRGTSATLQDGEYTLGILSDTGGVVLPLGHETE
jgi:hypothetical protein